MHQRSAVFSKTPKKATHKVSDSPSSAERGTSRAKPAKKKTKSNARHTPAAEDDGDVVMDVAVVKSRSMVHEMHAIQDEVERTTGEARHKALKLLVAKADEFKKRILLPSVRR